MNNTNKAIRILAILKGTSLGEVAEQSGLSRQVINQDNMSQKTLERLCDTLGVTLPTLLLLVPQVERVVDELEGLS